ncbi:MAG: membrane protein insertase YidC [Deltaproteobacteria bacterium]|nr:membrane protein insertase YidC [Deltaproteobacteria bacterium]
MEHRALLAVILSLAILIAYQSIFVKPQVEKEKEQKTSKQKVLQESEYTVPSESSSRESRKELKDNLFKTAQRERTTQALAQVPAVKPEEPIKDVVVNTDVFEAVFTTEGGRIKSCRLRRYLDDSQKYPIEMVKNGGSLDFTPVEFFDSYRYLIYSVDKEELKLYGSQEGTLTFSAEVPGNLRIEKKFTFRGDRYNVAFRFDVINTAATEIRTRFGLAWEEFYSKERLDQGYAFVGPAVYVDGKRTEIKPKDIKQQQEFSGAIGWVAFEDKYFINGMIPTDGSPQYVRINKIDDNRFTATLVYPEVDLPPGVKKSYEGNVYLGPKLSGMLALVPNNFSKALNYGWFDIIARPLLIVLKWLEKHTHNWGIAIILLTILIKIIFYPLTHKSYKSMKEMQKIQPKMAKLREKYKNDKEKINREMWHLYKTHKVNPLGGCLPMILQIPVFFALYRALLYSIEIRHSPFIPSLPILNYGWITDLSSKDPLYITPLIMGASMFLQQKMTPTTGDPTQAKIMLLMPVVFTVMFLNFPSGLVIYWLVNNVLSIGQQFYINKYTS